MKISAVRFGLRDYGIDLSPTELEQVFLYFDSTKDGYISVDEFLIGIHFILSNIILFLLYHSLLLFLLRLFNACHSCKFGYFYYFRHKISHQGNYYVSLYFFNHKNIPVTGMRGEMNDRRKRLIKMAFNSLDKDGSVRSHCTDIC